jgi:ligand-binding SRPBCC domain-containing protein
VQLRGPYSFWHHTHLFRQVSGGTQMTDTVYYAMPFGFLGRLVHAFVIKQQLTRVFEYRSAIIATVFEIHADLTSRLQETTR